LTVIALLLRSCSKVSEPENRVLLIGIDGAEWDILNPMIAKGELPNIAALKAGGSYGALESLELMLSPIIWTSIATGKSPEKHGITWFMVDSQKAGQRIPVTSATRRCKAIWNILSENDRTVGVVGWWATYPAEEVNGFIVSDHLAYQSSTRQLSHHLSWGVTPPCFNLPAIGLKNPLAESGNSSERGLLLPNGHWKISSRHSRKTIAPSCAFFRFPGYV